MKINNKSSYLIIREEQLLKELKLLKSISHPGTKGEHLENLLRNFLEDNLPKKYSIGSGFIVGLSKIDDKSSSKNFIRSNQIDIVIFDEQKNTNPLKLLDKRDFFIESVYGAISVKKELTSSNFMNGKSNMFDNLLSAKEIQPAAFNNPVFNAQSSSDSFGVYSPGPIIAIGFAYSSNIELNVIKENLDNKIKEQKGSQYKKFPDMIAVLGKGIVQLRKGDKKYEVINCPKNTLEKFFISFLGLLNNKAIGVAGLSFYNDFYK